MTIHLHLPTVIEDDTLRKLAYRVADMKTHAERIEYIKQVYLGISTKQVFGVMKQIEAYVAKMNLQ